MKLNALHVGRLSQAACASSRSSLASPPALPPTQLKWVQVIISLSVVSCTMCQHIGGGDGGGGDGGGGDGVGDGITARAGASSKASWSHTNIQRLGGRHGVADASTVAEAAAGASAAAASPARPPASGANFLPTPRVLVAAAGWPLHSASARSVSSGAPSASTVQGGCARASEGIRAPSRREAAERACITRSLRGLSQLSRLQTSSTAAQTETKFASWSGSGFAGRGSETLQTFTGRTQITRECKQKTTSAKSLAGGAHRLKAATIRHRAIVHKEYCSSNRLEL